MEALIGLAFVSVLGLGTTARAAPAWMLICSDVTSPSGLDGRAFAIREFPSMASCEAVATHIHSLRGIPPEADGLRGIWRSNRKAEKGEPVVVTLCVHDFSEVDAFAEPLRAADRYKLLD